MYVPDNYDLFVAHDAEQARMLERLPVCDDCLEPIQDEYYYVFSGRKICQHCMEEHLDNCREYVEV